MNINVKKNIKKNTLPILISISFIILFVHKIPIPFLNVLYDKDEIDFRKLIFINIYIYILLQRYKQRYDDESKIIKFIRKTKFIIFIPFIVFIILNRSDNTFFVTEYLIYQFYILSIIILLNLLINDNLVNIKRFLSIISFVSIIIFFIKPFIDLLIGGTVIEGEDEKHVSNFKYYKYSNYRYFNKNIKNYDDEKNYNKRLFNTLMNYIIINIILIGSFIGITSFFKKKP